MIQNLQQMIFATLLLIFLSSCAGLPKVTLHQIDTIHSQANPFKITNYNKEICQLELQPKPPFNLIGPELHGGVCLTKEDYARIKSYLKAKCENEKLPSKPQN